MEIDKQFDDFDAYSSFWPVSVCFLLLWRVPSGLASGGGFKKMPVAWLSLNYIGIDDLGRTPVASLRALFSSQLHRD